MSFDTYFRIVIAILGLVLAVQLAANLVTGRTHLSRRTMVRATDKAAYWRAIGVNLLFVLSLVVALCLPDRVMSKGLILAFLVGQLLQFLVSGEIPRLRGRVWSRARGDRGYWIWVAIHSTFIALFIVFFILLLGGVIS